MKFRIITFILCFALILVSSGCNSENTVSNEPVVKTSSETLKATPVNLLYNKSDSFNPYTAVTVNNRNLCKLIFEPLVKTDNSFSPVYRLAKDIKLNGKTCTVTIIDTVFSDGTRLTADDVVYSCKAAMKSSGIYKTHLYEVESVSAANSKTVIFKINKSDPYFVNLLDFPVFKSGSEKGKDSDGVAKPPVGCGRYVPNDEKTALILNKEFFGTKGKISSINLINAPDEDSESHYIEVGAAEMYYSDLRDGKISRMSGKRVEVNLNNFIYLGVNMKSADLFDRNFRYALSSAIDRSYICRTAYYNNASPATGYFNPALKDVKAVQSLKDTADTEITVENLKKMGYNDKDKDGYYIKNGNSHKTFKLIVNTENRSRVSAAYLIASQLKTAGICVNVTELSEKDYYTYISRGYYDLYLGEISVLPNFDMSPLVISGGSASYGVSKSPVSSNTSLSPSKNENSSKATSSKTDKKSKEAKKKNTPDSILKIMDEYNGGVASIKDVAAVLLTEMVQIPIAYRKGLFFYQDEIISGVEATESDIYYSIEKYNILT